MQPEPLFDLDGSEIGEIYQGDNFTLVRDDKGRLELVTEGGLTLDDLAQLRVTLDQVLGGAKPAAV